nr:hypothetical protein [Nocardia uniformis]
MLEQILDRNLPTPARRLTCTQRIHQDAGEHRRLLGAATRERPLSCPRGRHDIDASAGQYRSCLRARGGRGDALGRRLSIRSAHPNRKSTATAAVDDDDLLRSQTCFQQVIHESGSHGGVRHPVRIAIGCHEMELATVGDCAVAVPGEVEQRQLVLAAATEEGLNLLPHLIRREIDQRFHLERPDTSIGQRCLHQLQIPAHRR